MKPQPTYYAVLTAEVRYSKVLKPMEKLMFAEITCLSQTTGECWAPNRYFADLYEVSTGTVSKWIANLVKHGFVKRRIKYKDGTMEIEKRFISLVTPMVENDHTPMAENNQAPMVENDQVNTTSFNSSSSRPQWEILIDNFKPSQSGLDAITEMYGNLSNRTIQLAISEFLTEAEGRNKPFKTERAIQAGFNKYVRKDYLKALKDTKNNKPSHASIRKKVIARQTQVEPSFAELALQEAQEGI